MQQCHAKDTPTRFKFEQDNLTKVEIQQKWKYKKTFNSSGQSCVSNMKLFHQVVVETSMAKLFVDKRTTDWHGDCSIPPLTSGGIIHKI